MFTVWRAESLATVQMVNVNQGREEEEVLVMAFFESYSVTYSESAYFWFSLRHLDNFKRNSHLPVKGNVIENHINPY